MRHGKADVVIAFGAKARAVFRHVSETLICPFFMRNRGECQETSDRPDEKTIRLSARCEVKDFCAQISRDGQK
jgi:hypothetical protein